MKISIVSINYAPEPTGISVYSTGLCEFLAAQGHDVTCYTAFSYYPAWRKAAADRRRIFADESINGVDVRRSYIYVPARPSAARRIFHEFSFVVSSAMRYLVGPKGDVVIVVMPPLLLGLIFGLLCRFTERKLILHVQDLQPDAAIDLGMLKPGLLTHVLFKIERWSYALATRISTISLAMCAKIESKGVRAAKCTLFKNWANDDLIAPLAASASLKSAWSLEGRFVVLYAGNMGVKQGLGMLLDAAERLRHVPDIVFVIVGDGGEKEALMERARRAGLTQVEFRSPVAKEDLGRLLDTADVSVITQKKGIDDLVLPSKLANLMASGKPLIVSTQPGSELAGIIDTARCGVLIPPEDGDRLAQAIEALRHDPEGRAAMGERGRIYAAANLTSRATLSAFERVILAM